MMRVSPIDSSFVTDELLARIRDPRPNPMALVLWQLEGLEPVQVSIDSHRCAGRTVIILRLPAYGT